MLSGGQHVVVSSTTPIRTESVPGHPVPVSLALHDDGEGYVPANPVVPVVISKRAQSGIAFPFGLSVTPVSVAGAETPTVVGDSVVFANAGLDTDLIEEPLPGGAEMSWQLRSQDSSPEEGMRFDLPPGALLRTSASVPGGAEVVEEGGTVLRVSPATAQAADGSPLGTSYSVSGDVLTTHVDLSGNVEFPVLVDPAIYPTYYGEGAGSGSWAGWKDTLSAGYLLYETPSELEVGASEGESFGSYGELYTYPPGPLGLTNSAGITRVNLYGLGHNYSNQSDVQGEINESNGAKPAYTFEPNSNEHTTEGPLNTATDYFGQTVAFCAQEANGSDSEKQPLCNEELNQGKYFYVDNIIAANPRSTVTSFTDFKEAEVIYRDPTGPNRVVLNHPGYEGQWLKAGPTNFTVEAEDEGMGIGSYELWAPAGNPKGAYFKEKLNCTVHNAVTECPRVGSSEAINLSKLEDTGPISLSPAAADVTENVTQPSGSYVTLYMDQTPPVMGPFTGALAQDANHVIGSGNYALDFSAEDGAKSSMQSGVKSIEVKVDGKQVYTLYTSCPEPKGEPAEGCYDLSGSWTMNGQTYGAGAHTITVVAKDWAGNESSKSLSVTVNEAAYEPLGPGAASLETGDLKLNPTDVSVSGGDVNLSVSRTYDSRKLAQGATGPLGPQWTLSLPDSAAGEWQSLAPLANGSVAVYTADDAEVVFTPKEGGGYNSPASYQTLTLTEPSNSPAEYQITDTQGDYTSFTQPASGAPFVPSKAAQATAAGGLNRITYSFTTTAEGITEPTEVLAPEPSEGACTAKLVQGCRALTFTYATSTTAEGEGPSEWNEYKGRLSKVLFTAWDPTKGEMTTTAVAQYAYDKQGRLRAEWDPRVSPALKTTYGYDAEGHITAVSSPGQQPWVLHYGTIAGDSNAGRLLSVVRPAAQTALWKGEALKNTAVPVLSGPSDTGVKMSVTNGTWSGGALAYAYQWEDCNTSGEGCTPILGATNPAYTPTPSDLGHTLVAQVTATNAGGAVSAASAHSTTVVEVPPTYASQLGSAGSGNGQMSAPSGVARDGKGNLWVLEALNNRVQKFNEKGEYVKQFGSKGSGTGQLSAPDGLALDAKGNVWVADTGNNRVEEFNEKGEYVNAFGSTGKEPGQFNTPQGLVVDAKGNVWVADSGNSRVQEFNEKGEYLKQTGVRGAGNGQLENPFGVAIDSKGNVWVVDHGNNRLEEFNEKGEYIKTVGSEGTGDGEFKEPEGITIDASGNVWVGDSGNFRVEEFNESGEFVSAFGKEGTGSGQFGEVEGFGFIGGLVTDTKHDLWVTDGINDRIEKWTTPTISEGATPAAPPPRWTLEYHVPVSGTTEAPYQLGSKELKAWAQADDPTDATAIFPPDEPQNWPASDYTRASIFYLDSANRTVNTASPSGAISTAEYNSTTDNLERTLTADNREAALKEGSKGWEVAELLSTQDTYSSDGTELTSTLGPQHTVKLANGTQVAARKHTQYFYDESAPGGKTYHLVTKTIEGAQISGEEEKEKRTITTSYSGQENLGWNLHAATSSTTSTGSESLTTTTSYEPSTGEVRETGTPIGSQGNQATYASTFGSHGTGNGQMSAPAGVALDAKGDLWVVETFNNRVQEFNEKGEYIKAFGALGTGNGQLKYPSGIAIDTKGNVWIGDTGNNRVEEFNEKGEYQKTVGSAGTEAGHFTEPTAIAIDTKGNVWVADAGNGRVEEFNEKGEYQKTVGAKGTEAGQMSYPEGLAMSHGNLWVADMSNNRVDVFNEKGEYTKEFGTAGTGNGQFKSPRGINIDSRGDVWVGDASNNRVQEFNESGEYVSTFGAKGSGAGQFNFGGNENGIGERCQERSLGNRPRKQPGREVDHTSELHRQHRRSQDPDDLLHRRSQRSAPIVWETP